MNILKGMPILALFIVAKIVSTSTIKRKVDDTNPDEEYEPKGNK